LALLAVAVASAEAPKNQDEGKVVVPKLASTWAADTFIFGGQEHKQQVVFTFKGDGYTLRWGNTVHGKFYAKLANERGRLISDCIGTLPDSTGSTHWPCDWNLRAGIGLRV
jgi:hypothetical protein